MLQIQSGDVDLAVDPWIGGGITSFKWRGLDIFRTFNGSRNPLDLACFPLIPFCNRIAQGRIVYGAKSWALPPAPVGTEPVHALHGIGWRSPWSTIETHDTLIRLGLNHDGALWPWAFSAQQQFELSPNGFTYRMSVTNNDTQDGGRAMPAGLGLHPFFPREGAHIEMEAQGWWETGEDRLPLHRRELSKAPRWFEGPTKKAKGFDHCFERVGSALHIDWPTHRLRIRPSQNLPFAHVFTPKGEDFFCVEPVSHIPNAVHSAADRSVTGLVMLPPGETMEIECEFDVEELA